MPRRDPANRTRYWQHRRIPGMSLLHADFTSHEYGPHTHDAFVIAVTESGSAEFESRGHADRMNPSMLFVSNPEEKQSARMGASSHWRYRAFYLTAPAVDAVRRELGIVATPYFMHNLLADREVVERFSHLHRACDTRDDLAADELMTDAFSLLFQRHGDSGSRPEPAPHDRTLVRQVVDMMQARHADPLTLDELAGTVGLTHFQLIGLFKRTLGLTPHAYLVHIRLNAASRLLKRGVPLAECALAAGFCDQSALTRHFKRCYGITPLQFAAAYTG